MCFTAPQRRIGSLPKTGMIFLVRTSKRAHRRGRQTSQTGRCKHWKCNRPASALQIWAGQRLMEPTTLLSAVLLRYMRKQGRHWVLSPDELLACSQAEAALPKLSRTALPCCPIASAPTLSTDSDSQTPRARLSLNQTTGAAGFQPAVHALPIDIHTFIRPRGSSGSSGGSGGGHGYKSGGASAGWRSTC